MKIFVCSVGTELIYWKQNMRKIITIVCCLCFIHAQAQSLGISYGIGATVPNHPLFPQLEQPAQSVWIQYAPTHKISLYQQYYPRWQMGWKAGIESTGNAQIMGSAFSLSQQSSIRVWERKGWRIEPIFSLGLAYLNKLYNPYTNPRNTVIGSHLNAYGGFKLQLSTALSKQYRLGVWVGINHYSNGGTNTPNLGINIPSAGILLSWTRKDTFSTSQNPLSTLQLPNLRQWALQPFLQASLGMTDKIHQGIKYPIYTLLAGVSRRLGYKSQLSAGVEYIFNTGVYELYALNQPQPPSLRQVERWGFLAQHELIFGHFALLTGGGIYLNKHLAQRSPVSAKIGINYYPKNLFLRNKSAFWVGVQVRTYFGEAEFVELASGFRW